MEVIYFDSHMDRVTIDRVFPPEAIQHSSAFFGAVDEEGELCGIAALGYEQDTLLLQYLFVPEKYRRRGVGTALLDDISERLAGNTESFMEAYMDEKNDYENLKGLFQKRADYHVEEHKHYAAAYWLGVTNAYAAAY
ncbi:MAG: GNAT family N-acetyltransferase [Lachnospiraceae bacterium]|nr:GNAT family N-acetyltransferase [Lachnospiraceae bacterium]